MRLRSCFGSTVESVLRRNRPYRKADIENKKAKSQKTMVRKLALIFAVVTFLFLLWAFLGPTGAVSITINGQEITSPLDAIVGIWGVNTVSTGRWVTFYTGDMGNTFLGLCSIVCRLAGGKSAK